LVFDHPFFARPDSSGRFSLDDVPVGEYQIIGWHERIRPISHTVRVEAGRTVRVDFNIPLPPSEASER
jgi:hypothetical protein